MCDAAPNCPCEHASSATQQVSNNSDAVQEQWERAMDAMTDKPAATGSGEPTFPGLTKFPDTACPCGATGAHPAHAGMPTSRQPTETEGVLVKLVDDLNWALDIMQRYEKRLIQFGDSKELVHSAVHISRFSGARGNVEYAWQMLRENSPCGDCRNGNVSLDGWHHYGQHDARPCEHVALLRAAEQK